MHLLVYTGQVSGRLNDKQISQVGVLYNLKAAFNEFQRIYHVIHIPQYNQTKTYIMISVTPISLTSHDSGNRVESRCRTLKCLLYNKI